MHQRIELWKRIYDTEDNAISKALSHLTWNLATFSCVVEIIRHAPEDENGKRLNGMVLELLASGFWSTTMLGVRRLADRGSIQGPTGVCSLRGLIRDAKDVRHRLTRRVFVEDIAGLDYDFNATKDRYWAYVLNQPANQNGIRSFYVPRKFDHDLSQRRHAVFDWLSGTVPENASPDDVIREEVFNALERRLARLDDVVQHAHVEIAHAATESSRRGRLLDRWDLNDAKGAIKELAQVAQLAGEWFCNSGIGTLLPHPQFDQFAHLDRPLFTGDTQLLQAVWDGWEHEIGQWHNVDPKTL